VDSTLDLPRPGRSALGFAALAAAALALDADPRLPWPAGVAAALCFGAAGTVRMVQEQRELVAVRRAADHLIVHSPRSRDASELVRWRARELTSRAHRERLRREVERTLHRLDPALLPSASPLRRPAARGSEDLLRSLQARVGDEQPVAARGILLAESLLRDPSSPLYSDGTELLLPQAVRRVIGALEL
jgi:hypothetical protein